MVKTFDVGADVELTAIEMKPGVCGATDFQPTTSESEDYWKRIVPPLLVQFSRSLAESR